MPFVVFKSRLGHGFVVPREEGLELRYLLREPLQPSERRFYHHEVVIDGIEDVVHKDGIDWLIEREPEDPIPGHRPAVSQIPAGV